MNEKYRKFGPRVCDADKNEKPCAACDLPFLKGQYTVLVTLGPGADEKEQEKCLNGQFYNAVAVQCHWACVTGEKRE